MKRILCVLLVAILAVGLIGCSQQKDVDKTESKVDKTEKGSKTADVDDTELEPMTISIGHWSAGKMLQDPENDLFLKLLEEKFNVTFEGVGVSWSDYKEKYKLWAAADELPDVFATAEKNTQTYESWINQGVVKQIPEDLSAYPNIERLMNQADVTPLKVDGMYYMIPRLTTNNSDNWLTDRSIIIRKDWLDELGLDVPKSYEEFKVAIDKMVNSDLDGNGVKDTVGTTINSQWSMEVFFMDSAPSVATGAWIQENGEWIPPYMSDEVLTGIERLREMYKDGLLDRDFALLKDNDGQEKFGQGNVGALTIKSTPSHLYGAKLAWDKYDNAKTFEESIAIVPLWANEEGVYNGFLDTSYWSESYFNSGISDEKFERLLMIYNYLLSEEFAQLSVYGFEGIDYTMDDGTYKPIGDETVKLGDKYPSYKVFNVLARWGANNELERSEINNSTYGKEIMEIAMESFERNLEIVTPSPMNFDVKLMSTPAKTKISSINFMDDVVKVIISDKDVQDEWAKVVEGYKAENVEEAIKEVGEKVKELGIK